MPEAATILMGALIASTAGLGSKLVYDAIRKAPKEAVKDRILQDLGTKLNEHLVDAAGLKERFIGVEKVLLGGTSTGEGGLLKWVEGNDEKLDTVLEDVGELKSQLREMHLKMSSVEKSLGRVLREVRNGHHRGTAGR